MDVMEAPPEAGLLPVDTPAGWVPLVGCSLCESLGLRNLGSSCADAELPEAGITRKGLLSSWAGTRRWRMSSSECITGIGMPEVVGAGWSSGSSSVVVDTSVVVVDTSVVVVVAAAAVVVAAVVVVVGVVVGVVDRKDGGLTMRMTLNFSGKEILEGDVTGKVSPEGVVMVTIVVVGVVDAVGDVADDVVSAFFRRTLSKRKFSRRMRHDERCELT